MPRPDHILTPNDRAQLVGLVFDVFRVGVFDPVTETFEVVTTGLPAGQQLYWGVALAGNGHVVFPLWTANNVGIFDPVTMTSSTVSVGAFAGAYDGAQFDGAATAHDGRVVMAPYGVNGLGVYSPWDHSFDVLFQNTLVPSGYLAPFFRGATALADGRVALNRQLAPNQVVVFDGDDDSLDAFDYSSQLNAANPFREVITLNATRLMLMQWGTNHNVGVVDITLTCDAAAYLPHDPHANDARCAPLPPCTCCQAKIKKHGFYVNSVLP